MFCLKFNNFAKICLAVDLSTFLIQSMMYVFSSYSFKYLLLPYFDILLQGFLKSVCCLLNALHIFHFKKTLILFKFFKKNSSPLLFIYLKGLSILFALVFLLIQNSTVNCFSCIFNSYLLFYIIDKGFVFLLFFLFLKSILFFHIIFFLLYFISLRNSRLYFWSVL